MRFYLDADGGLRLVYRKMELKGRAGAPSAAQVLEAKRAFLAEERGRAVWEGKVEEVVPVLFVARPWLDLLVMGRVQALPVPPRWMAGARGLVALFGSRNVDGFAVARMQREGLAEVGGLYGHGVAAVGVAGGRVSGGEAGEFVEPGNGRQCFLGLTGVKRMGCRLEAGWKTDGLGQRVGIRVKREVLLGMVVGDVDDVDDVD